MLYDSFVICLVSFDADKGINLNSNNGIYKPAALLCITELDKKNTKIIHQIEIIVAPIFF